MISKDSDGGLVIDGKIDQLLENLPLGSISKVIGNNLYGINFRQTGSPVPRSRDNYGFTFFTRPQLNMHNHNISNYRGFHSLMTDNAISYQRFTRLMLDPRLQLKEGLTCPFVDNKNGFISVLTNDIISLSGWPDLNTPTYTSQSGLYGEEHSIVDGVTNHFESYDIDVTFRNTKGNPLLYMFYIWIKYQTLVFEGILNPYLDMITENEIDYNTRIYRVVLDQQKRFVTQIASTGASFPINVPLGNIFDFNKENPLNSITEINIRFRCMGFTAFEDLVKLEFNKTQAIFNADMRRIVQSDLSPGPDRDKYRDDAMQVYRIGNYVKIPYYLSANMDGDISLGGYYSNNHRAYPYINLYTSELEWWTDATRFNKAADRAFDNSTRNMQNAPTDGLTDGLD